MAETKVGKTVALDVWRKKQKIQVTTTVAEVPEDKTARPDRPPKIN